MELTDIPPEYIENDSDRHGRDVEGNRWSQQWADHVVGFVHAVFTSQFVEGPFRLMPWQEHFLRKFYGVRRPDGKRAYRTFLIHCGKKNGKTLLISAVAAIELFAAGVHTPRIAVGSTTRDNAEQVADELRATLEASPLGAFCTQRKSKYRIDVPSLKGRFWSLSKSGRAAQGLNLSACLIDEYHAHADNSLYDSLRYSTKSRRGIIGVISTAGDDVCHPYFTLYSRAKRIANSEEIDSTFLPLIYEADPNADPMDVEQWRRANPSLGVAFSEEDFRLDLLAAKSSVADWMTFSRYNLNQWVRPSETAFVDMGQFDRAYRDVPEEVLLKCPAFMGCDLSTSVDASSASLGWLLPDGSTHVKSWAWVCSEGVRLREKQNLPKYREFVEQGSMVMTQGNMIDHTRILNWIRDTARKYKVKTIAFDSNNALIMTETLQAEGFNVVIKPQFPRHWNGPMREWERALAEGKLSHNGGIGSWLRYTCGNVRFTTNDRGEIAPSKAKSPDKIDGFVSACMAFGEAAIASVRRSRESIYNTQPVRCI